MPAISHRYSLFPTNHAIKTLLPVMALAVPAVQFLASPPSHIVAATLTIIQCTVILHIIDYPLFCLSTLTAIDALTFLHAGGNVPSAFLPALLALGCVCHQRNLPVGFLSTIAVCLAEGFGRFWHVMPIPGNRDLTYTLLIIVAAACLGRIIHCREHQLCSMYEQEISEWQARHNLRDERLANSLHSAVTAELSLIARTAQRQIHAEANNVASPWPSINLWAMRALDEIHRLIEELDQGPSPRIPAISAHSMADIRLTFKHASEQLTMLGMKGRINAQMLGHRQTITPRQTDFIIELSEEIFANIARHAAANSEYEISVLITDEAAEITELNLTDDYSSALPRGGHGLAHYKKIVERQGGTFTYSVHDNLWTLYVFYPLQA